MARRGYSNVAAPLTLTSSLNNSDTSSVFTVSLAPSGWPSVPYFAVLDMGTTSEELIYVTAVAGTSITATRGGSLSSTYGSTTKTHSSGSTMKHVASAADFDEANAHVNANTGVHGVTGSVVGTTDSQTLTNKTLTTPTIGDFSNAQHTHTGATSGGALANSNTRFGVSGWLTTGDFNLNFSGSTGSSYTAAPSAASVATVIGSSVASGTAFAYSANLTAALVSTLRGTYFTTSLRAMPFVSAVGAGGKVYFSLTGSSASDPTGVTDSAWIGIDPQTGAVTVGGRNNAVNATGATNSPPTIAASTGYDIRIDWPIAGGVANCYINNALVGTVTNVRALSTALPVVQFSLHSGAGSVQVTSRLLSLAMSDN